MMASLFWLIFFSFLLIKATDILVINLKSLSQKTRLGQFALTSFLLALATSLPELFVGVTSALEKHPNLSLGNVIGANIANLSLVVGGAALLGGTITVQGTFLNRDVFYAFLAGAAPMVLLFDKYLGRIDGLILLCLYGLYNAWIFAERKKELVAAVGEGDKSFVWRLMRRLNHRGARREIGWMFLGMALLLFSAEMIVRLAEKFAVILNIPLLLIGLFIVSVGTTLPELVFELKVIRQHHPTMVFGNLLGSIVANGTLIIGLVALIEPIRVQAFAQYLLATMAFVVVFGAFYFFVRTKHKLERWEGVVLVGLYLVFVLVEFIRP